MNMLRDYIAFLKARGVIVTSQIYTVLDNSSGTAFFMCNASGMRKYWRRRYKLRRAVGRKVITKNMCAVFVKVHQNAIPEK